MIPVEYFFVFFLVTTILVVAFRTWLLVRMLWNLPLAHGPGFFLGVEVAPGFYEGPGARWLSRYRRLMLAEYLVEVAGLAVVVVGGRWGLIPICSAAAAALFVCAFMGFAFWSRAMLKGVSPATTRVAVPLEGRSLRDYISWRTETVISSLVALSWISLLTQGMALVRWRPPVVLTYLVLGLFAAKIGVVRMGFRLPVERTQEHHLWFDAHRRLYLRLVDSVRFLLLAILTANAILSRWPTVRSMPWLFWGIIGLVMGTWVVLLLLFMFGSGRLAAQGRDLRPPPCGLAVWPHGGWLRDHGLWWTVAYAVGFALLLVFFRR
jgi:hypothetical protein